MLDDLEKFSTDEGASVTINIRNGITTVTLRKDNTSTVARAKGAEQAIERALREFGSRKRTIHNERRQKERARERLLEGEMEYRDEHHVSDDPRHSW